ARSKARPPTRCTSVALLRSPMTSPSGDGRRASSAWCATVKWLARRAPAGLQRPARTSPHDTKRMPDSPKNCGKRSCTASAPGGSTPQQRCKGAILELFRRPDEVAIVGEAHNVSNRLVLQMREQVVVVAFPVHYVDRAARPAQVGFGGEHAAGPAKRLPLRVLAELPLVPTSGWLPSHPGLPCKDTQGLSRRSHRQANVEKEASAGARLQTAQSLALSAELKGSRVV